MKFIQGQRISHKRNAKKGRIDNIIPPQGGRQFYDVLWDNGSLETISEHDLQEEIIIRTPWDLLSSNLLNDYRDFSIATTLHKVRNTTSNTISSLKASRTIFKPYQYKPLVKFLKSDLKRILIADEVGLGKTIEAGHIMLEMAARGNLKNVLVICTNSLRDKWKAELLDKFNFIMKTYENTNEFIQDIKNDISGSKKSIFGVLNYEKCRNEELQKVIEDNSYRFDLLICDEAHKIRNSETEQHRGVSKIVDNSDAVVFLTATPIMTNIRNLHNLVRVLDREVYDTFDIFNNAINQNKPFIRALAKLKAGDLAEIAKELHDATVVQEMTADEQVFSREEFTIGDLFKSDGLYQRARQNMLNGHDTIENRVKIQQDLFELNSLNHLYTRTRKKDVMSKNDIVYRNPKTVTVQLSQEEQTIYDSVINEYADPNSLGLLQRKRQMSSCIVGFRTPREKIEKGDYDRELPDSKFEAFKTIIDEVVLNKDKKIIVFAFFTNTLLYLQTKLHELSLETEIIYGGIINRTERIERFRNEPKVKILLSSEVGSEGLDFQFCDALVNYDLPWNPMVVEQRIGRIDRVGQESAIINIYNLIIIGTIEERIYERLYQRINLFRESIGDLEEILGDTEPLGELVSKGIESLYKTMLSKDEQINELDRLCSAIENERQTLNKISDGLQESFANDIYFQNEIENITKHNLYLTKDEIIKYLQSIIRLNLSTVRLNKVDNNIYELEVPANNKVLLFDFIELYKDQAVINPELENLYRRFKTQHIQSKNISLTFDQQYAYEHKRVEYISAFHPLVNAITNYFVKNGYDTNQAHKVAIKREHLSSDKLVQRGYYILVVYRVSIKKTFGTNKPSELHLMRSAIADLNGSKVHILNKEISEDIQGIVQLKGEQLFDEPPFNRDAVGEIRELISMEMVREQEMIKQDEEVKFKSITTRRTDQELKYIEKRIARREKMIAEGKGIEAILRNDIADQHQKSLRLLENKKNSSIDVSHALISANLLQVL